MSGVEQLVSLPGAAFAATTLAAAVLGILLYDLLADLVGRRYALVLAAAAVVVLVFAAAALAFRAGLL